VRVRLDVSGRVQGVGFRPTVHRLAESMSLGGWVRNTAEGATIEVEGLQAGRFRDVLLSELPGQAQVDHIRTFQLSPQGQDVFRIETSLEEGHPTTLITPDLATCSDCLSELFDPQDRRYRYPFLNCTQCGPRFSILKKLPYDRHNTSMTDFVMCPECQIEYDDPRDRRFHAQPNACGVCGPQLDLPLEQAVATLKDGQLVALKGLGGFHLLADATNPKAVSRLRSVKARPTKPLAVMVASLRRAHELCRLNSLEAQALSSAQAPILLTKPRPDSPLRDLVAPNSPHFGIMLAYTPLHHLLLHDLDRPLVVTSANFKDDPLPIDRPPEGMADMVLSHNRPIVRAVDDSIAWVLADQVRLLRCGRGYAPLALTSPSEPTDGRTILAAGGHQKSSTACHHQGRTLVGAHLGELESLGAVTNFSQRADELCRLYQVSPEIVVADHHPDYASSRWAEDYGPTKAWHHHAHLASCLLDNEVDEPVLGCIWDGSGLGPDLTIWGGEFLAGDRREVRRVHHWTPYPLYGGEVAVREPRRVALALLDHLGCNFPLPFSPLERDNLRRLQSPLTSSTGRLFDGLSSLLGLCQKAEFEGQGAMFLEFLACPNEQESYRGDDWPVAFEQILKDLENQVPNQRISARFHNWLVEVIVMVAQRTGLRKVALSGGCFQNRRLTEHAWGRLRQEGFEVLLHRRLPPNDGGLSAGQAMIACV
jgi:hydrogenase maturation protein HypF